ncbi:MAG: phosphoribosylanthranilate isomerase [Sandarakinorhabdus sp.]|nr:phosphoribosylanthranilate isomerase [Sandarakinorhabdus sp.]
MTPMKFCGLSTPETVSAAVAAGARWLGFNFFAPSPRYVSPERAAGLIGAVPPGVGNVAVLVDADDALIDAVLAAGIDILQLHGRETPERIAAVKARTGREVWRAAGVATRADIAGAIANAGPADKLLLDAKAAPDSTLPGGNGVAFDWRLMIGVSPPMPWGLSGGLDAGNVGAALAVLQPAFVDVSSGIEERAGVKSIARMMAFSQAVRAA